MENTHNQNDRTNGENNMYILITAKNCIKCEAEKKLLELTKTKYKELKLNGSNAVEIMTKLRTSGIFKTEMPILVKEVGDDWEEVE